ncbi:MAG: hypothetical protein HYY02_02900 [Chloroflexi bacterium]|nr:hypothetical protein [Chloroflexota bacterium]
MVTTPTDPVSILRDLARLPTTSFHEEQALGYIRRSLEAHGIPYEVDPYGDILARYRRGEADQPLALVAHTDHPGFEVTEAAGDGCRARLLGGVFPEYLHAGVPVRVFHQGQSVAGVLTGPSQTSGAGETFFDLRCEEPVAPGDWGVWEMDDFREDGDLLHLRAADDLAGCAVTLATLFELQRRETDGDVYLVFTRAEEVGLLGALLVAQQGLLPPNTLVVSVESSRTLPGAEIGGGPVIRVGDVRRTFHPEAEAYLQAGWEALRLSDPGAKVQRQLLSGGTCEATAFGLYGYRTTGVALPLGNYHNMGPGSRLAPECIHRRDLAGAVALLTHTVSATRSGMVDPLRGRYEQTLERHRQRLKTSAQG